MLRFEDAVRFECEALMGMPEVVGEFPHGVDDPFSGRFHGRLFGLGR